ncbi:MAG: hypothetical protein NC124_09940 [Clostridium sp.]|nr:hypothetical protein [Clostridium sp.]
MKRSKWRICLMMGILVISLTGRIVCAAQESTAATIWESGSQPEAVQSATEGESRPETADLGSEASQEPADAASGTLKIDNQNIYAGMKKSYAKGYVPSVKSGKVTVVLPLLSDRPLKGNKISTGVRLGEGDAIPFVQKNYQKDIDLKANKVNGGEQEVSCYLVTYALALRSDRINGSYPVVFSVTAADEKGNEINQDFTVYVTITDGKAPLGDQTAEAGTGDTEEEPQFVPKLLVQSYAFSRQDIQTEDSVTADIVIKNTSKTEDVKNLSVTVTPGEGIALESATDSVYIESVEKQGTVQVSFAFRVLASAPQGQHTVAVAMDYADSKGNPYTSQGTVKLSVSQHVKMQFDPIDIPESIEVGETVVAQTQAMNLGRGKIYNVRAEIQAEGLTPKGTMYIGDIEAGLAAEGAVEIRAVGLSGNSLYGTAKGVITFYYEDEAGSELEQEMEFSTSIVSPLAAKREEVPEDNAGQWWVIMAVLMGILLAIGAFVGIRYWRHKADKADWLDGKVRDEA